MPDWSEVFVPSTPILEIVLRGTLVFLALTVMLRIAGQRESGALAITDLVVVVLVARGAVPGHGDRLPLVPEGLGLAATILVWSVLLDAAAYRFRDSVACRRVMRREFLNDEELLGAYLEPNGMISVFRKDSAETEQPEEPAARR